MINMYQQCRQIDFDLTQDKDFSSILFQQDQYFPPNQSIINFAQKEVKSIQKAGISPWNENNQLSNQLTKVNSTADNQKHKIQQFLSTIRMKNQGFRSKINKRIKNSFQNDQQSSFSKCEIFLPLNKTVIMFPKSRNTKRSLQKDQKQVLQQLYQRRQKCKLIPRQISLHPSIPHLPSKDYLSKTRSFTNPIQTFHNTVNTLYNPQSKQIKILDLTKRISPHYASSFKKRMELNADDFVRKDRNTKCLRKIIRDQIDSDIIKSNQTVIKKSLHIITRSPQNTTRSPQNIARSPQYITRSPQYSITAASQQKMYKTLYANSKYLNLNEQMSIAKIKQQAKNSHLNRNKIKDQEQMHLFGSTIQKWKSQVQQRLK